MNSMDRYVIGVDLGGTKILMGKMREDFEPYDLSVFPTRTETRETIIDSIFTALSAYLKGIAGKTVDPPLAVGFGLVGHIDPKEGVWENAINIPMDKPIPVCSIVFEQYGIPVAIDNDVHAATLAELYCGAGRQSRNFIYINIGTGISAGLVCDGRIIQGISNYAGEIGHMVSGSWERICKCGRAGCLEPLVSGGGIIRRVLEEIGNHPGSSLAGAAAAGTLNAGDVYREAEKGDTLGREIVEDGIHALEQTVVNLANLLNPELIVFGGGALEKEIILGRVQDFVYHKALPVVKRGLKGIILSTLDPEKTGLIGAGCLAWKKAGSLKEVCCV